MDSYYHSTSHPLHTLHHHCISQCGDIAITLAPDNSGWERHSPRLSLNRCCCIYQPASWPRLWCQRGTCLASPWQPSGWHAHRTGVHQSTCSTPGTEFASSVPLLYHDLQHTERHIFTENKRNEWMNEWMKECLTTPQVKI